jgi:hypothetical protein
MDYPPNSKKAVPPPPDEKKVDRITTEDAIRKKKSLGKQFKETFIGGDAKTAAHYALFGVLIPAAKDAVSDAGTQAIEKFIFGESRTKKRGGPPVGATGYVNYNRYSMNQRPSESDQRRAMSRRARSQHDFDEIILPSRTEAENVIDGMFDIVSQYGSASVADFYGLLGLKSAHTDHKWGWTDLRGSNATRVRNGFFLDLPEPEPLD